MLESQQVNTMAGEGTAFTGLFILPRNRRCQAITTVQHPYKPAPDDGTPITDRPGGYRF